MSPRRLASIAVALVLVLSACSASPRPADVVVYASGTDLESANPLVTIHPLSRQVQRHMLFVTLARQDSALAPQPYYARRWDWSPDRRRLTLRLYEGLRWHDGRPTSARDVAFTLLAARDPRSGYARASDLASIENVTVVSDTVVRVSFDTPQRDIPAAFLDLPILPEHLLGRIPLQRMRGAPFNTDPVGNGPFRFVDRVAGQRWTFATNPDFPVALGGPPAVRQVVIAVVDEPTTKFAGLAAGDLDFAGIAPTMAGLARRDPTIRVLDYPVLFSVALVFNTHRPPFDDVRIRRAVNLSVDRDRIVRAAMAGFATAASGPVPPENPLSLRAAVPHDTAAADALLDAAGWRRGRDGWRATAGRALDVELLTVGSGDNAAEQLVQSDLASRGIRVRIRQLELAAFLARARAGQKDFDFLITGIPGDLSLAYLRAMYESSQRGSSLDYSGFHSAALDALFAQARVASSDAAARDAWLGLQRELATQVPAAWLYHSRGLQGMSSRMRGVRMDLRGELATVARWTTEGGLAR